MDMYDPNDLELWRERCAELLRETESHRLAHRLRTARRGKSTRSHQLGYRIREALRIAGEP